MRQRLLIDQNWRFALGHAGEVSRDFDFARTRWLIKAGEAKGAAAMDFDDSKWRVVNIPHDWAVELPFDPKGDKDLLDHGYHAIGPDHPENSIGWYRREFEIPRTDEGRRLTLEFDGVFRDSAVFVNGHYLGRHASGYTPFRYDITDVANYGGRNVLAVRADASKFEGWWYEGAGIYRKVWLLKTHPVHVAPNGVVVTANRGKVTVRTTVTNDSNEPNSFRLTSAVGNVRSTSRPSRMGPRSSVDVTQRLTIKGPKLWSPDEPNLYRLRTTLQIGRKSVDQVDTTFGIRATRWDANRGFFLNGKPLKIKGFCCHEDHAGVGVAVPDAIHELRLRKLKATGCNAYRAAHNCASPIVLDLCDRLGLLVMAETRQAGSHPEALDNLRRMIERDRNHPSIILWSIGNEEHSIQWKKTGERIGKSMKALIRQLDPTRPITAAMHDRSSAEGFMNVVDVHGWNYTRVGNIEAFRRANPRTPIVVSEESSVMTTRGVYVEDPKRGYCIAYDQRTPKWGLPAEKWWTYVAQHPWLAGGFAWTGFDHRGEPIAYKWPNVVSHFGVMDLCGFEKDNYYYYQACWADPRKQIVLHLLPHWNWRGREGEPIDVRCFSNCDEVELFLNERSLGRKQMPANSHLAWQVPFTPGKLEAHGFRGGRRVATRTVQTTGAARRIILDADGIAVTVRVADASGLLVPTADNLMRFEISGAGRLIGVGNGDPSSHESDKAAQRRLFNGKCLALIESTKRGGNIDVTVRSRGLASARITLPALRVAPPPRM